MEVREHELEEETEGLEEESDPQSPQVAENNLLARLRKIREEARRTDRTHQMEVPGYGGNLVAVYEVIEWDEMKKIGEKHARSKNPRRELHAHIDTILKANVGLLARDPKQGLINLDPDEDAADVTFADAERLASLLGFEQQQSARQTVRQVFPHDIAITSHHHELTAWMEDATEDADEEFLGESEGETR